MAPYNFGISPEWWKLNKDKYADETHDWLKYEDPEGFGSKAITHPSDDFDEGYMGEDLATYDDVYE